MDKSRWAVILGVGAVVMVVALCGLGLLLAVGGFWRFTGQGGMMGDWCPGCGGTGVLGLGPVAGVLALLFIVFTGLALLGLLVLGAVWLVRRNSQGSPG